MKNETTPEHDPDAKVHEDLGRASVTRRKTRDWHERADPQKCHAASQRSDGECWWRYCPAKDGHCPLPQEEYQDE